MASTCSLGILQSFRAILLCERERCASCGRYPPELTWAGSLFHLRCVEGLGHFLELLKPQGRNL